MIPSCDYCTALLAEMRSSITEARAIQQDLKARIAAGVDINENSVKWQRFAMDRWTDAKTDLTEHLTTHRLRPMPLLATQN